MINHKTCPSSIAGRKIDADKVGGRVYGNMTYERAEGTKNP